MTLSYQLSLLDGLTGVPTRTTPTLTPTTLRNIEQTFMDLAASQVSHEREAGFVPPMVPATNSLSSSASNYTVTVTTSTQQGFQSIITICTFCIAFFNRCETKLDVSPPAKQQHLSPNVQRKEDECWKQQQ